MRKIIHLLLCLVTTIVYAQTEFPLRARLSPMPNDVYLKDVNNELNQFVGNWIYTQGSTKYTIRLEKIIKYKSDLVYSWYYVDLLMGRKKIQNNNSLVYNSLLDSDYESINVHGVNFKVNNNNYIFIFYDPLNCNLSAKGTIVIDPANPNKMIWKMEVDGNINIFSEDCPLQYNDFVNDDHFGEVLSLPFEMILTKVPTLVDVETIP